MRSLFATACGVVCLLAGQAQSAVIIDNFDDAAGGVFSDPGMLTFQSNNLTPTIIGDERDINFVFTPAGGTGVATFDGSNGQLQFIAQNRTATFTLTFDGDDNGAASLGNISAPLDGAGFLISAEFNSQTASGALLSTTVTLNGNTIVVPALTDGPGAGLSLSTFYIPYAAFGYGSAPSLQYLTLSFTLNPGETATFNDIRTTDLVLPGPQFVPEPSSIALAFMGLVGFGGYARRRMKARA